MPCWPGVGDGRMRDDMLTGMPGRAPLSDYNIRKRNSAEVRDDHMIT